MKLFLFLAFISLSVFAQEIYKVADTTIDGKPFKMEELKGKTILIVNIASQCGYTKQLSTLEELYQKYKAKNFVVLGVPTNDFGGQTPEDDQTMKEFCSKKYSVTFPLLKKSTILGKEKRPLYKYLTEQLSDKSDVKWNFEKFLVDKNGKLVERMSSKVEPMDKTTLKTIEAVL